MAKNAYQAGKGVVSGMKGLGSFSRWLDLKGLGNWFIFSSENGMKYVLI